MNAIVCTACTVYTRQEQPQWVLDLGDGRQIISSTAMVLQQDGHGGWAGSSKHTLTYKNVPVLVPSDKFFDGTWEQAETAGWVENEYGIVCAECAGHLADMDDEVHSPENSSNPLIQALSEEHALLTDDEEADFLDQLLDRWNDTLGFVGAKFDPVGYKFILFFDIHKQQPREIQSQSHMSPHHGISVEVVYV